MTILISHPPPHDTTTFSPDTTFIKLISWSVWKDSLNKRVVFIYTVEMESPTLKKAVCFFIYAAILPFMSASASPKTEARTAETRAIEEYLDSLPESQRIAQIFLVNIQGNSSYFAVENTGTIPHSKEGSSHPLVPGGALFFSYNLGDSAESTMKFTESIARYCRENKILRPYLAVDQEGGAVNRLRDITSYLSSNAKVAEKASPTEAYELYAEQAKQMRALGFDMNLAPVAECLTEENAPLLGLRSYGGKPETIVYSMAAVKAYQDNGISAVLKHFPGNTDTDPHTGLPEIKAGKEQAETDFLEPFFFIMASSPDAVLMSHARIPSIHSEPACLSSEWVNGILCGRLGFKGIVISDDIFMGALAENGYNPDRAAVMAIEAGVHVIMLSEKTFGPVAEKLLEYAEKHPEFALKLRAAEKKVIELKIKCGILKFREENGKTVIVEEGTDEQIGTLQERKSAFAEAKKRGDEIYRRLFR